MANGHDAAGASAAQLAAKLAAGATDSLPKGQLAGKLELAEGERRPLRVKLGIDPTAPDLHLGHAVVLRKLRQFQDAGHRVVLIIGDFTARVGDPSGRSSLRPMLSLEEIEANAQTFYAQALKVLDGDPERIEVRRNSEWLEMPMGDLLALVRRATAAQLLEREDFAKRWQARQPISLLELLYPVLQGYDSVAVRADLELGGTDQKFNLLLARDIQRAYGQAPQAVLTMPLLVGTDGRRKMSKSLGNEIGLTDPPQEIYGKTMKIPDDAIGEYRALLLGSPGAEPTEGRTSSAGSPAAEAAGRAAAPAGVQARDAKRTLARELVQWLYSAEDAAAAERDFERVFVDHEQPAEIAEGSFEGVDGTVHLPGLIAELFGVSRSQARRLIDQGGVSLDGSELAPGEYDVAVSSADGKVLQVGKRGFKRLHAH